MAQSNLEVVISARDQFTATANRVTGSLNRMQAAAGRVGRGVGQLGAGMARIGAVAATAAATGLVAIAKATISWESALAGVNKTMDLTPTELQAIGDSIRKLSTQIPLGAEEIAGLVEQAGALGIAKKDVVEFAKVAATIGVTTNVSADQAATSLGVMSNLLGLTGKDFERFASTLVDLGNKGASTEAQILAIAERAAGAGATIGLSADKILAFSSAVANLGIEPEAGGSSLQKFFLETLKFTNTGGKKLEAFAKTAGLTATEMQKLYGKEPEKALGRFIVGLSKLDKGARLDVLKKLGFDDIRITRMLLGLAEAEDQTGNLAKSLDNASKAWSANTAAAEEADKRYGTIESKLKLLWNQFLDGARVIGEGFLPALGRVSDKLKKLLGDEKVRADLRKFGQDIGKFIDGINWDKVLADGRSLVGVLRDAAGFAKGIFDAFNSLPPEMKAALLAFAGLNKVSGGLLAAGIGNIFGGLLGGITTGLSRALVAAGIGKMFVQPVFVTNPGFGGALPGGAAGAGAAAGAAGSGALGGIIGGAFFGSQFSNWLNTFPEAGAKLQELADEIVRNGGDIPAALKTIADRLKPLIPGPARSSTEGGYGPGGVPFIEPGKISQEVTGELRPPIEAIVPPLHGISQEVTGLYGPLQSIDSAVRAIDVRPQVNVRVVNNISLRPVVQAITFGGRMAEPAGSYSWRPGGTLGF